jgi:hypothetical protein
MFLTLTDRRTEALMRGFETPHVRKNDDQYAKITELAERHLRRIPYLALKAVSCDWLDGTLVLQGRLPTYYLKQVAQEAVAKLDRSLRIENLIQVA